MLPLQLHPISFIIDCDSAINWSATVDGTIFLPFWARTSLMKSINLAQVTGMSFAAKKTWASSIFL